MSILNELSDQRNWLRYLNRQVENRHSRPEEIDALKRFISEERWRSVTSQLERSSDAFPLPNKVLISKKNTNRKRTIYIFPEEAAMVLKLMNFLLERYDGCFSPACYAFRSGYSVKDAVRKIGQIENIKDKYTLKLDIHNYFGSIPVDPLLKMLQDLLRDDAPLLSFLSHLLRRNRAIFDGTVISEPMGAIPGTATAGFFANLYLTDVDHYFVERNIPYFRYSDDILIFADTQDEQQEHLHLLTKMLDKKGLSVNPQKFALTAPGERWEYLGFSYSNGVCDLARCTVEKTKARIRRYARYIYREKCSRQGMCGEEAAKLFLRRFNAIFFDSCNENEFSWNRWYFSIITTSESLKEVDACMQQYLRYLYTGRHYKGNYKISYEKLKQLGYRSLVHEYYKYLETPPMRN